MLDKKSVVTVLVVLIIMTSLASVIIVSELNGNKSTKSDGAYQAVARVNNEGSGIYIEESVLKDRGGKEKFCTWNDEKQVYEFLPENAEAWGGLIVGTPGTATIQHVYMQQIVESMGLTFTLYQDGEELKTDHVYFNAGMNNQKTVIENPSQLNAGMLWEPQYSMIVDSTKYTDLVLTNDIFPGHTCCIIVGNMKYMLTHSDVTERFLIGYTKAVNFVNEALSEKGEKYDELVEIQKKRLSGVPEPDIKAALENITYAFADDESGSLDALKKDLTSLTESLEEMGSVSKKISDLGYAYPSQFVDDFVDDSYIKAAVTKTAEDYSKSARVPLTVACISGDIHQIALHVATEKGYFEEVKLTVTVSQATNGPGVAVAMQNNTAQFGFLGAPPATITTINGMLITA